jgi:hypothetical protein
MNAFSSSRTTPHRHPHRIVASALAVAVLAFAGMTPAPAWAVEATSATTPLAQAARDMRADYRQQQWQRLAQKKDRDSLIAAVLLGMPNDAASLDLPDAMESKRIDGNAQVEQHLANAYGKDPLALFALALACQLQAEPCTQPEHYYELVRIEPDNAMNWLLLPNGAAPSEAQLHAAARATHSDTHLRDTFRIVLAALADQPAPALRDGVDPQELALQLRRDAVEQVMLPKFGETLKMCKGVTGPRRDDCIAVGRLLEADRSGSILSRMIGSAMIRRLLKGTPEEVAAKQLRREYVWMSDLQDANPKPDWELVKNEDAKFGEWEAWRRAAERMGKSPVPPADWIPKNPQTLLLSEERTPVPAQ